ncbi:hypothetical protein [Vitiosangium sp. GDMCC 1.1324]|uniref:hypothetical protein n=1 Tax=Vitiosangium sp. (strain GDMCC 1.1324) TaxID=2138576 RepID=UPI000D3B5443|nr:hypothetical protein [Vitiosangium sp. GDMCC 1.1324]PTL77994.1 hypothetical protein DAT35_40920 [Vitiosangium sp. GDMCC 1.1324]
MPRSYSFEHFTVPKTATGSRSLRRRDKQQLSEKRAEERRLAKGLNYGRSHAETEEMFQVRAMNAQLEALAGLSPNAPVKPTANNLGQPIGALPVAEEPLLSRGALRDVLDEALRQFRALQSGIQDATRATGRLLSLPMDAVRLAAQRLRLVQG